MLWACAGLGVILGPILEGAILGRGMAIKYSYLLASAVSVVQLLYQGLLVTESLPVADRRPFSVAGINPLGFLQLFTKRTPRTLKKLVLVASFQSFLEGKNVVGVPLLLCVAPAIRRHTQSLARSLARALCALPVRTTTGGHGPDMAARAP